MIDFVKKGGSSLYTCQSCGLHLPYANTERHAEMHKYVSRIRAEVADPFAGEEWEDYG